MRNAVWIVAAAIILIALLGLLYWVALMFMAQRFAIVLTIVVGLLCLLAVLKYFPGGRDLP